MLEVGELISHVRRSCFGKEQGLSKTIEARNVDGPVGLVARTLNGLDFQGRMRAGTSAVDAGTGFSLGSSQSWVRSVTSLIQSWV